MAHLQGVTAKELRRTLNQVEGKRATQRVMVGLNYKDGLSQRRIAGMYGRTEKTIYNWLCRLDRLADEPAEDVVYDAPRSGRPPRLTDDQHQRLAHALRQSPTELGYDEPAWTPRLARRHIAETFGVEYELRRVREFMRAAGLSYRTVRSESGNTDACGRDTAGESSEKRWLP